MLCSKGTVPCTRIVFYSYVLLKTLNSTVSEPLTNRLKQFPRSFPFFQVPVYTIARTVHDTSVSVLQTGSVPQSGIVLH